MSAPADTGIAGNSSSATTLPSFPEGPGGTHSLAGCYRQPSQQEMA